MGELPMGVGVVGLGTIGVGVARVLAEHAHDIEARLGFPLVLRHVADLDWDTQRPVDLSGVVCSRDFREVLSDPDVHIVVELVGGTGVAREIVLGALRGGKRVVTANKALLAHHGAEIYAAAEEAGSDILFEASVGGTIPVLRALREGLCADRIEMLQGIVNGTCNFVLSRMENEGGSYAECLTEAQALGFAEPDPTFDVEGIDSAHKLVILLGLALGVDLSLDQIPTRGITKIESIDLEYAREFGLRIKLLAIGKRRRDGSVEARVEPTLIPLDSVLAGVHGSMNAVEVRGVMSGSTLYYGAGAGSLPTASAVVADAMELARGLRAGIGGRVPPLGVPRLRSATPAPRGDLEAEFYVRFSVEDQPGVLAEITGALSRAGISIASVHQPEQHESGCVPVVLVTHRTRQSALEQAISQLSARAHTVAETQILRIEREL